MCGIVAQIGPLPNAGRMRAALAALVHRGPDATTLFEAEGIALGHTRLSVIAPEDGAQPVVNEDKSVVAVVSGELYDHVRIRREMSRRGHRFRTRSDSEILVHLYEEYGDACLEHLRGEFAFVLWDERERRLFAARDRFGVRPLLYAMRGAELCIASEAKALFQLGILPRWDMDALFVALHAHYVPADRTLFQGVRQLRPGQALTFQHGELATFTYWDMDLPRTRASTLNVHEAERHVSAALDEAVRLRLVSDVPLCVQLSGGIDSSVVAALAVRHSDAPVQCFTVSFEQSAWDEAAQAQVTADMLGARLTTVRLGSRALVDALPGAVRAAEGLAVNLHIAAKYLLARRISKAGFRVVLTGEGADEVFLGYAHLRQDFGVSRQQLAATNRASAGLMLAEGQGLSLDGVRSRLGFVPSFLAAKATLGRRVASLLTPDFVGRFVGRDPFSELLDAVGPADAMHGRASVDVARYAWSKTALATYILRTLGDGMEMSSSIEGRVPMLDHVLYETVRDLPRTSALLASRRKSSCESVRQAWFRKRCSRVKSTPLLRRRSHFLNPPCSRN